MRPRHLAVAGTGVAALAWVIADYRAWRALGPGGLPSTLRGWLTTTRLRMLKRDPLATAPLQAGIGLPEDVVTLTDLPARLGGRPAVGPHPVPHRQLTDHAPPDLRGDLAGAFAARAARDPAKLEWVRGRFEKHNMAVAARADHRHHVVACAACGEAGHVHPSDGSMHMILSPSDACAVIDHHWGELHGLAGHAFDLPPTYTLIYAPRDAGEVTVALRILDAAIAYMTYAPAVPAA